jgi:hypothetical protein
MDYTKNEKGILRKLFGQLYELELIEATTLLAKNFEDWKGGKITVWNLEEEIHKFHNGASRHLFNKHSTNHAPLMAAYICEAIVNNKMKTNEIPYELLEKIKSHTSLFD